ncbi:MAG: hypothetical protein ACNA8L_10205 [Luteolibacter sp.]
MMNPWQRSGIVALAILATGAARMPVEQWITDEMRESGLLPRQLEVSTREKIGQTSAAVALGGLRTLVATFLNLRAFGFFTEQRWANVDETYRLVVDLSPRTRYYWETASWHQAYNAASYYQNDSTLPALRRREAWRASIVRGREILEQGINNNPDDGALHAQLGFLLRDPNKIGAFGDPEAAFLAASEAYARAADRKGAAPAARRFQFYTLARVSGREAEALALGRQLYEESTMHHAPTLLCVLFALEAWENPEIDHRNRAIQLFGSAEQAVDHLGLYWQRVRERFPVHGVARALEELDEKLGTPAAQRVLNQPLPRAYDPEDAFADRSRRGD